MSGTDPIPLRRPARVRDTLRHLAASTTLGPVLLLAATVVAMALANSPWGEGFQNLWHLELGVSLGSRVLDQSLLH